MIRLIDANALIESMKESAKSCLEWKEEAQDEEIKIRADQYRDTFIECALRVKNAPTIESEPVRHGRWIFGHSSTSSWMTCSICRKAQSGQTACFSFCPNCGARMNGGKKIMGIRLYFRKKDIESEEFCLGKLYTHMNHIKDYETLESVCFLRDVAAADDLLQDHCEYEYDKDLSEVIADGTSYMELFGECVEWTQYIDYGDFFQMTKAKCREFIKRYLQDHARVWGHEYWYNMEQCALDFMQRMSSSEKSVFEFRLGARL